MIKSFVLILTAVILFYFLSTWDSRPFSITPDMGVSEDYIARHSVDVRHPIFLSVIKYTSESAKILTDVKESDLLRIRCSDQLVRTDQGVYILKHLKTQARQKRRVTNNQFIEYMRKKEPYLSPGKKVLTVRACENNVGLMFMLYSIGEYDKNIANKSSIHQVIYNSKNNEAYVEVFRSGIFAKNNLYKIEASKNHLVCNEIFQMRKYDVLSILCSEESEAASVHKLYDLNMNDGSKMLVAKCKNGYPPNIGTVCN